MEIKPMEEESEPNYPKKEEKSSPTKKRTIKTWQKIAIVGTLTAGIAAGIIIYKEATKVPEGQNLEGFITLNLEELEGYANGN